MQRAVAVALRVWEPDLQRCFRDEAVGLRGGEGGLYFRVGRRSPLGRVADHIV